MAAREFIRQTRFDYLFVLHSTGHDPFRHC